MQVSTASDILDIDTDVLVVGGTAAGCSAAIAAARAGSMVVVLEPTLSIGGVSANGVHCFDVGSRQALSGTAEEFTRRVLDHYKRTGLDDTMLHSRADVFWEFHVADRVWRSMLAEHDKITFIDGAVPIGVIVSDSRIEAVHWESAADAIGNPPPEALAKPNRVRAKVVIDASYEGDVAAWAGAEYDLGREARTPAEPHAGIIHTATHERRVNAMGYLPDTILPGSSGAASDSIMSFTSRLSLRYAEHDDRRRLVARPDSYDPGNYAWKAPALSPGGRPRFGFDLIPTVNGKMLLNQRDKGNDVAEGTRDYVTAHPRERTAIRKRMFDHILGFLHFIQTEGGMPQLALAADEYPGNGNVPYLLYVREGRRFRGRDRLTEANINPFLTGSGHRPPRQPHSIAIGDWAIECRPCGDEPDPATNTYEGAMLMRALRAPYQVPFGCLAPAGVDNLLVTTAISASHVAFCALRIEAVWTQTGTAAGLAANLSAKLGCRVGEVPIELLQARMLELGCKLTYFADLDRGHVDFAAVQWLALRGFLPDDGRHRFFPEVLATWGDLMEAAVRAFDIPISVTGLHFDGLEPDHPAFRYAETLYDTASRADVVLFPNMRHPAIDEPADHLRPEPRSRWLDLPVDQPIRATDASAFLHRLAAALGRSPTVSATAGAGMLSRGAMATLLRDAVASIQ